MKKTEFQKIEDKTFQSERSLYNLQNGLVTNCIFEGEEDGESPLKESSHIKVENCLFRLRYAFWHVTNGDVSNTKFGSTARAPFWYSKNISLKNVESESVKIFRECKDLLIEDSKFVSEEPFWKTDNILVKNSEISGFYAFFQCKNVQLENVKFGGKYSFQYNKSLLIENSVLDTKDAFWHCENVVVKNSIIKGEYIGWYSKKMTFINCTIESHQPFCYAKNIILIDCKMPNCDLAFEKSSVKGNVIGKIDSVKNPNKMNLVVDEIGEFIKE